MRFSLSSLLLLSTIAAALDVTWDDESTSTALNLPTSPQIPSLTHPPPKTP